MPVYITGEPITVAGCPGCCETGTGTGGECLRFPCSCCTDDMPQLFDAVFDAAFQWADGSCVGTSATIGTFGDGGFTAGGGAGSPCMLLTNLSGGGGFDGLTATLQSEDNVGTPCVWTIQVLPTSFGCGAIAPAYFRVDDFDCCLESQTCTLTPLSVPSGWTSYPTQVTLTSCGCDSVTGTGTTASFSRVMTSTQIRRRRARTALPTIPPCQHEGRPAAPPEGRPLNRRYYECEKGHGIVCQCDCNGWKCKDYAADV